MNELNLKSECHDDVFGVCMRFKEGREEEEECEKCRVLCADVLDTSWTLQDLCVFLCYVILYDNES